MHTLASLILPHLFLGAQSDAHDEAWLVANSIRAIFKVSDTPVDAATLAMYARLDIQLVFLPLCDSIEKWLGLTTSIMTSLFASRLASTATELPFSSVLLHCQQGISRSAAVAVAYRMSREKRTSAAILREMTAIRPQIKMNPEFVAALKRMER